MQIKASLICAHTECGNRGVGVPGQDSAITLSSPASPHGIASSGRHARRRMPRVLPLARNPGPGTGNPAPGHRGEKGHYACLSWAHRASCWTPNATSAEQIFWLRCVTASSNGLGSPSDSDRCRTHRPCELSTTPIQAGLNRAEHGIIEIAERYREGLDGLAEFDYAWLLTWLHQSAEPGSELPLRQVPFLLRAQQRTRACSLSGRRGGSTRSGSASSSCWR